MKIHQSLLTYLERRLKHFRLLFLQGFQTADQWTQPKQSLDIRNESKQTEVNYLSRLQK